jgi:hypothetical protein
MGWGLLMFALQRVYAFAVTPQRRADDDQREEPIGGAIKLTQQLRELVENAFAKIGRGVLATVDFELDATRGHPVRDDVLAVAFGSTNAPRAAAGRLALRLSDTMDNRSHAALLVVAVEADEPKQRVSLLVLPREDVVQLGGASRDEYLLNVLRDAFSTGSGLRKLARCEGHQSRTQFLSAEVLDFQLASAQKMTADFWIKSFLRARPRINSENGSRLLAAALQRAFDAAEEDDRDAVFAAMFKARSATSSRTSLERYAEDEIPEKLHEPFLRGIPKELARSVFTMDRAIMKTSLGRHVITTADGVVISAPTEAVGETVEVTQRGTERVVSYIGTIEKERVVRGRRAAEPTDNDHGGRRRKVKRE